MTKQDSITHLEESIQQSENKAARAEQQHQLAVQSLHRQNSELREIIAASMHTKRASTIKLETAMNALNLSKGNASRFIQARAIPAVSDRLSFDSSVMSDPHHKSRDGV